GVDSLLLAAAILLTRSPTAGLTLSFWLSFCSLALLMYVGWTRPRHTKWWQWLSGHWWMSVLLAPMTGFVFQMMSITAPLANAVAIPVVTLAIVPILLLGIASFGWLPDFSDTCWSLAGWCWNALEKFLTVLAAAGPPIELAFRPTPAQFVCAIAAVSLLLLPFRTMRWVLAPCLLVVFLSPNQRPLRDGEFQVDMLDVGQGLSVIVATKNHVLVYDAGARYATGRDLGADVVVPHLKASGWRRVDRLVISHKDNDHAGGANAIVSQLFVYDIATPEAQWKARPTGACVTGLKWSWDGVQFVVVHPNDALLAKENDRSCVIRVRGNSGTALLTGDIETTAERAILATAASLTADVLLVPHHGSATSSHNAFLKAVSPRYALVSAGYRNRFGHPAPVIRAAYRARGIELFSTIELGAITVRFGRTLERPLGERERRRRYWDP
ncbi:MAG: DNA internalization-related competence protein ComEC/Rec2, partial [Gammaproteobacteria bacterium]